MLPLVVNSEMEEPCTEEEKAWPPGSILSLTNENSLRKGRRGGEKDDQNTKMGLKGIQIWGLGYINARH
jgi:hypothetical protein